MLVEYGWALKPILENVKTFGCALAQRIYLTRKVPGQHAITAMHCLASMKMLAWALMSPVHFACVYFFKECPTYPYLLTLVAR